MTIIRVLILGHSFIRRLLEYIGRNTVIDANLHILEGIELKWHELGGRRVLNIWETIPLHLKKLYYYRFAKQLKLYLLNSQSAS